MPSPRNYVRQYSFAGFQANNPNRPLPGPPLDNELENIEQSLTETISALGDIRRSDGALRNGIVGRDALAPDLATGVRPATLWQPGIQYQAQDTVSVGASFYRCTIGHISALSFLTDLSAGRWELYADIGTAATDAEAARNEAVAAAAAAANSANSAAASYDLFDDRYLGEKTSLPTLDNDGNALVNGALVSLAGQTPASGDGMYVRRGGAWVKAVDFGAATPAPARTVKGNPTGAIADVQDMTVAQTVGILAATQAQAETGTDNATVMTPLRVNQRLTLLPIPLRATQGQAEAGTDNDAFMTPLRVTQRLALPGWVAPANFTQGGPTWTPDGVLTSFGGSSQILRVGGTNNARILGYSNSGAFVYGEGVGVGTGFGDSYGINIEIPGTGIFWWGQQGNERLRIDANGVVKATVGFEGDGSRLINLPIIPGTGVTFSTPAQAKEGTNNTTAMTPVRVKEVLQTNVILLSYTAVGNGVVDDAAAINAAILLASTSGVRRVVGTRGATYRIGAPINMRPGIVFDGNGATITQANGANLLELIEFSSQSASGAVLENTVIDGNRSNNADNNNAVLVRVGTASDVTVRNNTIRNSCGYGIVLNYGFRNQITGNKISNTFMNAVAAFNSVPSTLQSVDAYHVIHNNEVTGPTRGAFLIGYANRCEITSNRIAGVPWGLPGNRIRVNTSGTTITWVSGPNFAAVKSGMWAVLNNGAEYVITAVNSATSLTVDRALSTLTNTPADIGCGDGIGIVASAYCKMQSNDVSHCVSFGMGLSTGNGENGCSYNIMSGNIVSVTGKSGINVAFDGGTSIVLGNTISGNMLVGCASGSGGSALLDKMAITVTGQTAGKINQTSIIGNKIHGFTGDGRNTYWLGTDGQCSDGSIIVSSNTGDDCLNGDKIYNDIRQITIDAGWGSAAVAPLAEAYSTGQTVRLRITCAGTGYAFGPTVTVYRATDTSNNPIPRCSIISSAAVADQRLGFQGDELSVRGAWKATYVSTPADGNVFVLSIR